MKESDPISSLEDQLKSFLFYDNVTKIALENVLKVLKIQEERIKELEVYVAYLQHKAT